MPDSTDVEARADNTVEWLSAPDTTIAVPVYQTHYRWDIRAGLVGTVVDIGGCSLLVDSLGYPVSHTAGWGQDFFVEDDGDSLNRGSQPARRSPRPRNPRIAVTFHSGG